MALRKTMKNIDRRSSLRTQVLDFLINKAIVDLIAENESITISKRAVKTEIKRRMHFVGIQKEKIFAKKIEQELKIPYKIWKSEIPFELKKRQIIQIRLSVPPPTEQEIKKWYYKNKRKLGWEVKFKVIGKKPKNNSISEETKIYEEMKSIRKSLLSNKKMFSIIAKGPRNLSIFKTPFFLKWNSLFEIYKFDPNLAEVLSQMKTNTISIIFRDQKQRYLICLLEARRNPPLENVKTNIMNILYQEKENQVFNKWLKEEKKKLSISYFDREYIKENKIQTKEKTFLFY